MHRSRSPRGRNSVPCNHVLERWCSAQSFEEARSEWIALSHSTIDDRLKALSFRRDVRALLAARPLPGLSNVPTALQGYREMDILLCDGLKRLDRAMAAKARNMPLNCIFGPWEGGLPAEEFVMSNTKQLRGVISVQNVRGAFRTTDGVAARDVRILQSVSEFQSVGAFLVIVADAQLAPGSIWPDWTGYAYHGVRSFEADTVGMLVLDACYQSVVPVEGVGDERAVWMAVTAQSGCHDLQALVLGVYGPHPGYPGTVRQRFWDDRLGEIRKLAADPRFVGWPVVLAGDFNLHFQGITAKNARYEGALDRSVFMLLHALGFVLCNPIGTQTHTSGTAIDLLWIKGSLLEHIDVRPVPFWTDHARLDAYLTKSVSCNLGDYVGRARWDNEAEWDSCLAKAPMLLAYLIGWANAVAGNKIIQSWTIGGKMRRTRQALLDRVVWWRAVIYTVCGHLGGAVVVSRHSNNVVTADLASQAWHTFGGFEHDCSADEIQWKQEVLGHEFLAKSQFKRYCKYLELCTVSRGDAESYLSRLLKPKNPVQVCLIGLDGVKSPAETVNIITKNVLARAEKAGTGDPMVNRWVREQVRDARMVAQVCLSNQLDERISLELVDEVMRTIKGNRSSVRIPRKASKADIEAGRLCVWAVVNLCFSLGLTSTLWLREVAPIRKRGPQVVCDPCNLRPVSYVDELECIVDAVWLRLVKPALVAYSGTQQAGGKYDAVLMAIGVFMSLQLRKLDGLPAFLQKADLLNGFDLVWRDAVKLHLACAGIKGKLWLYGDSALNTENLRVRVGPMIGELATLAGFGVGQGRRAGVDLFASLVRPLAELCASRAVGIGVNIPAAMVDAYQGVAGNAKPHGIVDWPAVHAAQAWEKDNGSSDRNALMQRLGNEATQLAYLDVMSSHRILHLQFVDDTFNLVSSTAGLSEVNSALTEFCQVWRHRFQGGAKRPAVMAVGVGTFDAAECGKVCGEVPLLSESIDVLGVTIDNGLTLQPLLDKILAKLVNGARELATNVTAAGFGLPYVCAQFPSRVENAALYGCELLASYAAGWSGVARALNDAQYRAAKCLLGMSPGLSLGAKGHVRVLCETRFFTRLSSKVALRIILARARLLALPVCNPVGEIVKAAHARTGPCWLDHARMLSVELGVYPDFTEFTALDDSVRGDPIARRRVVTLWKHKVVWPALRRMDDQWFKAQLEAIPAVSPLHYGLLAPRRLPFATGLLWAPWGPTMWRFFKLWCIARITGWIPLALGDRPVVVASLEWCPLCGCEGVDLVHVVACCSGTLRYRENAPLGEPNDVLLWVLRGSGFPEQLHAMVSQLGLSVAAVGAKDLSTRRHPAG